MNPSTFNHIKQLIQESGLINHHKNTKKTYQNFNFSNETILITGAAGTIGSELTKQLLACQYKKLILIDIAESPLYGLIKDLENENQSNIEFLLLNIKDEEALKYLFETFKPSIIFHTAAYKHVPLMEAHPYEAIKTNIIATKLLADVSIKHGVKKFIFISTDKAVNPINVMGISKYIAETYLRQLDINGITQFSIARFGNVMGSNGSVLPIFIKQIETGLPLSVTCNSMTRYFIGKHKACYLILKLATLHKMDSNVFTFYMGKPIHVNDLAKCLISFYPNETIEIKITGFRPGEKQEESIVSNNEILIPTEDSDILLVKEKQEYKRQPINLNVLSNITPYHSTQEIKEILLNYI